MEPDELETELAPKCRAVFEGFKCTTASTRNNQKIPFGRLFFESFGPIPCETLSKQRLWTFTNTLTKQIQQETPIQMIARNMRMNEEQQSTLTF